METLSNVTTIMGIVRDILSAVETASQNKSRCKKVAERVRCIKGLLEMLHAAPAVDGTTTAAAADAATRRLLDRLEEALVSALQVVRGCQRSSVIFFFTSGRTAELLDGVERDIDRCIVDLTLANSLRIARLETLLVRQQLTAVAAAGNTKDSSEKEENKRNKGSAKNVLPDKMMKDPDGNTTASTAIGVPVCTAATAVEHEMVPPPPAYGYYGYCCSCRSYHYHSYYYYYYYWGNHGCTCDCREDGDAGEPSSGAAFYHTHQYSSYRPSMFSDDDPNSCSIM